MSRLTELLRQARKADEQLGKDLEAEIVALTKRRSFGLVFEKHQPEAVELPGRAVRRGDKVRVLPPRGEVKQGDQRLWRVDRIERVDGTRVAHLSEFEAEQPEQPEQQSALVEDVVVVAEFRDRIYPGLVETGRVERGGDKPFHTVINAENYHALEMLTYTHRHSIDAIYIDPPYNTGAKDWKYNNNYVEGDDDYRHSKWLAFMERRLEIAKELLNPEDSVLIVTIDEKEYLRLGMLLEQTFPEADIQMVSSVISQKGSARGIGFSRCDEYLFFVMVGAGTPTPYGSDMLRPRATSKGDDVEWGRLTRNGANGRRTARPNLHYPIYFMPNGDFHSVGESMPLDQMRDAVQPPMGCIPVFPTATDGTEMTWALSPDKLREHIAQRFVKFGSLRPRASQPVRIYYLTSGYVQAAREGSITLAQEDPPRWVHQNNKGMRPMTVWNQASHNAAEGGTNLLKRVLPGRRFPFPKSVYAVEDALRFFVKDKPHATVLDFFSGSGTTAHAVMRLNKQDDGRRQSISVTNNEVSAEEQRELRKQGLRPGDPDWEALGICDYITKPRVTSAITGKTPEGDPIKGDYRFTDEFPMAEGFEENAAFFTLTYEDPLSVRHHRAFERVAAMLWLRAGSRGRVIDDLGEQGWDVAEAYGVLVNVDQMAEFVARVAEIETVETVFVVTDSDAAFQMTCRDLPERVTAVRLYESYLHNFMINRRAGT
ncbi:site-specific DNA-methyltransferase [Micrococcus endophyticus]|uniref:site-specific DNA-methyltransferase n=1 Tax=Micrococcus endophyticus TaxID=455343 RepID=UPI0034CE7301